MKIRVNADENIAEDEIIINCKRLDENIMRIQQLLNNNAERINLTFFKGECEYYLPVKSILFFETSKDSIDAHTADDIYQIKNKLYELEQILPYNFIRISKSAIININHIYSIDRGLTSARCIRFADTHKQVYVSRSYYKNLKNRLDEGRIYNE